MGVGLGGGVDAGVCEALGDNFESFAGLQQDGGVGMPQTVEGVAGLRNRFVNEKADALEALEAEQ